MRLPAIKNMVLSFLEYKKDEVQKDLIKYGETFIIKGINVFNDLIRQLIIAKGLNPDVIPVSKPTLKDVFTDYKTLQFSNRTPAWVKESFEDSSKHPINKLRLKREEGVENITVAFPEVRPLNFKKPVKKVKKTKSGNFRRVENE